MVYEFIYSWDSSSSYLKTYSFVLEPINDLDACKKLDFCNFNSSIVNLYKLDSFVVCFCKLDFFVIVPLILFGYASILDASAILYNASPSLVIGVIQVEDCSSFNSSSTRIYKKISAKFGKKKLIKEVVVELRIESGFLSKLFIKVVDTIFWP